MNLPWEHEEAWVQDDVQPKHLLWMLLYLKQYHTEAELAERCKCHEDTFCKWVTEIIDCIAAEIDNVVSVGGSCACTCVDHHGRSSLSFFFFFLDQVGESKARRNWRGLPYYC